MLLLLQLKTRLPRTMLHRCLSDEFWTKRKSYWTLISKQKDNDLKSIKEQLNCSIYKPEIFVFKRNKTKVIRKKMSYLACNANVKIFRTARNLSLFSFPFCSSCIFLQLLLVRCFLHSEVKNKLLEKRLKINIKEIILKSLSYYIMLKITTNNEPRQQYKLSLLWCIKFL